MPRKTTQKRRTQKRKVNQKRGGSGTASWAPYGGATQQHAGSEGNLIAPVAVVGGAQLPLSPAAVVKGGNALSPAKYGGQQKQKQQGAGVLNDLALPALLIYANNAYGRSRSSRSSSSRRTSRRSVSRRR